MASAQLAAKRAGSRSKQSNGATQTRHEATASQLPASQADFHQSLEDRLKTRQAYRGLRSDTYELRDVLVQPTAASREKMREVLDLSNQIYTDVKMPREGALDSGFLQFTSKIFSEQAERISSGFRSYEPTVFARAIRHMLETEEGVANLSKRVRSYTLGTDRAQFMVGPMELEVRARKERAQRQKDVVAQATRPEDVENLDEDEKNEVTKRVEQLQKHLPVDGDDMSFWRYIYDGTDGKGFGRTVENLFYSAFLVRDGLAGLDVQHAQPRLTRQEAPTEEDYVEGHVHKHQCVVKFDYAMWETLQNKFKHETYLPAPTAQALAYPSQPTSKRTASQLTSPNSKKRGRSSMEPEDDDDDLVSQIAPTPEEDMPRPKRPKAKK